MKNSKDNKEKAKNIECPPKYRNDNSSNSVPGINTPGIELPAFNPPVPNRAWTAMINGVDIEELSEEEKRDLYVGRDNIL